jgi:negative regulator of flagellin synthesis FlgM
MAVNFTGLSTPNMPKGKVGADGPSPPSDKQVQDPPNAAGHPGTVKLSSEAQALNQIEEQISQLPDIDEERVEALSKAIDEGRFTINPESIADKLLGLEGQLFE